VQNSLLLLLSLNGSCIMHTIITRHCRLLKVSKFFSTSFRRRDTEHFFLIVVKIARITRSFTFRDERSFHLKKQKRCWVCSFQLQVHTLISPWYKNHYVVHKITKKHLIVELGANHDEYPHKKHSQSLLEQYFRWNKRGTEVSTNDVKTDVGDITAYLTVNGTQLCNLSSLTEAKQHSHRIDKAQYRWTTLNNPT